MKILIVDSDKTLADSITCEFPEGVCEVHHSAEGEAGLKFALANRLDLIVLDWTLPKGDALRVVKRLRKQKNWTPILMLTPEDSIREVVVSLDSGANSCVTAPFEIPVLVARMKALMRRSQWDRAPETSQVPAFSSGA